jgi:hypothetical protein
MAGGKTETAAQKKRPPAVQVTGPQTAFFRLRTTSGFIYNKGVLLLTCE